MRSEIFTLISIGATQLRTVLEGKFRRVFDLQSLILSKETFILLMTLYFPLEIAGGHPQSWPTVFLSGVFYFSILVSVLYQYQLSSGTLCSLGTLKEDLYLTKKKNASHC